MRERERNGGATLNEEHADFAVTRLIMLCMWNGMCSNQLLDYINLHNLPGFFFVSIIRVLSHKINLGRGRAGGQKSAAG